MELKEKDVVARVRLDGFECDGRLYSSLSAAVRAATGTRWNGFAFFRMGGKSGRNGNGTTTGPPKPARWAIYTRKSTDEGLNPGLQLDAQRESAEAYIRSQVHEGWSLLPAQYDDGGYTGANMDRPALKRLLADVDARKVDCVMVYKVDRLRLVDPRLHQEDGSCSRSTASASSRSRCSSTRRRPWAG